MIYLVTCLEEEVDDRQVVLILFLKISLVGDHKDLVVLEDREVLICYMKLLFHSKM